MTTDARVSQRVANEDLTDISLKALKGVGDQVLKKLGRLSIHCIQDLLFHLPSRYEDRTRVAAIGSCRPGQTIGICGRIEHAGIGYGRRRALLARIGDGTGVLHIRLFHFSGAQQRNLRAGHWLWAFGEVRPGPTTIEMVHPEYRVSAEKLEPTAQAHLTAVYPATEGVSQYLLRRLIDQALQRFLPATRELIPDSVLRELELPDLAQALAYLHHPPAAADPERLIDGSDPHTRRLAFEELLAHHLSLQRLRARRQRQSAPAFVARGDLRRRFREGLDFQLTAAQQRVIGEIEADLSLDQPMLRLVQGDVGSGKTVVAAVAALAAVESGCQVVLLAPTELLAEQHYRSFDGWVTGLGVRLGWLSGQVTPRQRETTLERLRSGDIDVAIGTHALFQADVEFGRLGLVVVDEQHRFGVGQRLALRDKGADAHFSPHQLIMTATPIPRTLAMSFYADLDVSSIDELPPGRTPVETVVLPETRRQEVVVRVEQACREGRQAYWVCPLIDESEELQAQAANATFEALSVGLDNLRIGLVHGRMRARDKEQVMNRFRQGAVDLLVATTVIEVGVDVPNADLMIIENAERLGLSQLHQLRGRVGRGGGRAACVLIYRPPLSEHARVRLSVLRETTDGFEIARRDLELRGPGEVLGTRQTGLQQMRVADLARDRCLLDKVCEAGRQIARHHHDRAPALIRRWVGASEEYGHV